MGCASSQHYPPEIVAIDDVDNDGHIPPSKTGNLKSTPTSKANRKNNNDVIEGDKVKDEVTDKNVLRGDIAQKYQAKKERQEKLRDKQKKATTQAESLASQVMEERETLSLTSRSRGTSRATSRTASPTGNRKQIPYKPQMSEVRSEAGDQLDTNSSQQQQQNGQAARLHS